MKKILIFFWLFTLNQLAFADTRIPMASSRSVDPNYADSWHVLLAPQVWIADVNGFFEIHQKTANFNNEFNNITHNFDFGFDSPFEVIRAPWSLVLDPAYVKFTQKSLVNNTRAKTSLWLFDVDLGAYYQLLPHVMPKDGSLPKASLEVFGGGRIMAMGSTIYFFDNTPTVSDTSGFLVPIIGARATYNINDKLHTWINGNFGGFQMNHVESTWSGMIGLNYQLTHQYGLILAYRAISVHYYKQSTTVNIIAQGPMAGITLAF